MVQEPTPLEWWIPPFDAPYADSRGPQEPEADHHNPEHSEYWWDGPIELN